MEFGVCLKKLEGRKMGNNSPILQVRDLVKTFGAVVAAKDINVDISKGEIVGIIGAT